MGFNLFYKPPSKLHILLKSKKQKSLSLIPNLFTLGNAFFGFLSLIMVANGNFVAGAYLIFLGGLMDMLDGRIARHMGTSSELGLQLDSLCDAISFCVCPAFLVFFWVLEPLGITGIASSAFFVLTGILRLARFNTTHDAQTVYFLGIPTTMAAITLVIIFLNYENSFYSNNMSYLMLFIIVTLGILMTSRLKFPTFKHLKKKWYAFGTVITMSSLLIFGFIKVCLIAIVGYFLFAILENIKFLILKRRQRTNF